MWRPKSKTSAQAPYFTEILQWEALVRTSLHENHAVSRHKVVLVDLQHLGSGFKKLLLDVPDRYFDRVAADEGRKSWE